jgi:hypothetical protein
MATGKKLFVIRIIFSNLIPYPSHRTNLMPVKLQLSPEELFDIGVASQIQDLRSLVRIISSGLFTGSLPHLKAM